MYVCGSENDAGFASPTVSLKERVGQWGRAGCAEGFFTEPRSLCRWLSWSRVEVEWSLGKEMLATG